MPELGTGNSILGNLAFNGTVRNVIHDDIPEYGFNDTQHLTSIDAKITTDMKNKLSFLFICVSFEVSLFFPSFLSAILEMI